MNGIISTYKNRLHLQNAHFAYIDHEDAIVATVFKVIQPDGSEFILKICERNHYLREVYFLRYFANELPIPKIVQVVEPTSDMDGAILMECLSGRILKKTDLTEDLVYEIGTLLARIHLHSTTGYGDLIYPSSLTPNPRVHFTLKFQESLEECKSHLSQVLLQQCQSYYDQHVYFLDSVDGPCVIHRDFRPGNLIIDRGKLQGIIDWSSGRASFAEDDFCPLEHGEWSSYPNITTSFLAGYASIRPVPHFKEIMPFLRLSRTLATLGFLLKRGTWKTRRAHLYATHRHFLDAFFI